MFSEKLKALRIKRGLNKREMSNLLNMPYTTYNNYETNAREPNSDVLVKIANEFGVSTDFLLDNVAKLPQNITPTTVVHVPIVGRVAAGNGCYAHQDIEGYEAIPSDIISGDHTYVLLRVKGDSMSPKILEGDLVLLQCQSSVDSGSIAVVTIDEDDGVIKKVVYDENKIELISENPYYPPRVFWGEEVLRIRVMGLVKRIIRNI
ncbi:MAG TPA: hypothetical protein DEP23_09355 [Ruminococcaceae bacterium]|nr:hypothetical protein [Oscillospiraceae bacterium]